MAIYLVFKAIVYDVNDAQLQLVIDNTDIANLESVFGVVSMSVCDKVCCIFRAF